MSQPGSPIPLFATEALAAPGANTNFAAFNMLRTGAGVRITIVLATASVLNLRSDSTTDYTVGLKDSETLTAGDEHIINVPSLAMYVPGSTSTKVNYALQVETDGVIQLCRIDELLTGEFGSAVREPPSAAAIAAAIVANPPTIVVTDPAPLQLTTTIVGINDTVAQNQWTASVAVSLGGTYSGVIRDLYVAQYEDGTGAILTDMYGRLAIFDTDPAIAIGSTTLTAAQAAKLVDEIAWTNAELVSDTNSARLIARIEKYLASGTTFYVAFFWQGATSINSAAGDDERLVLRCAFERIT